MDPPQETVQPTTSDTAPTELRVHGVSGQPAEDMLDRAIIGQVAGDAEAGFFRPRVEYGGTRGPGGAELEAYRWGNLTSGAAARALWLLLLPFTLVNLTIWLRPPANGFGRWLVHGLCRVFALTLSATFALAFIGISVDLVAWQCGDPAKGCTTVHPWIGSLMYSQTGRRITLFALVPVALVAFLWFLARHTWARYESFRPTARTPNGSGLATPTFWDGREQVSRLRGLHVAAMFAVIDAVLVAVLSTHDTFTAGVLENHHDAITLAGRVLLIAAFAIMGVTVLTLFIPAMFERVSRSRWAAFVSNALLWTSVVLTVLSLAYGWLPRASFATPGPLPGFDPTITSLFAAQGGLLGFLLLVVAMQRHRAKGALLAGFGAPIIGSLGLGLGAAFSAGMAYQIANYLGGGSDLPSKTFFERTRSAPIGVQPPVSYEWAAVGSVLLLLVVLAAALWVLLVSRPLLVRKARTVTDGDYPGGRARDAARARAIDKAMANAQLTDHVPRVFAVAWIVVATLGVAATVFGFRRVGPVDIFPDGSDAGYVTLIFAQVGTWLIGLSVVGLVFLGIQTYRRPRLRRSVGIIWDLATFWPRAAHPLGPPCYAERVVPELVHRASWLATERGGVVLSGHSQGSVLVAATVLQMPAEARARTALLTYGCPISRLYRRGFPNYFGDDVLNDIGAAVAGPRGQERWLNLWRASDPIGGPVGIGDRRLTDPLAFDPQPGDQIAPKVQAHSGYQLVPDFADAMTYLLGRLA
jgi:hypothetical protein